MKLFFCLLAFVAQYSNLFAQTAYPNKWANHTAHKNGMKMDMAVVLEKEFGGNHQVHVVRYNNQYYLFLHNFSVIDFGDGKSNKQRVSLTVGYGSQSWTYDLVFNYSKMVLAYELDPLGNDSELIKRLKAGKDLFVQHSFINCKFTLNGATSAFAKIGL